MIHLRHVSRLIQFNILDSLMLSYGNNDDIDDNDDYKRHRFLTQGRAWHRVNEL